jgi:predicted P-loop ATPase
MAAEAIPLNAWRGRLQIGSKGERKTMYNLVLYVQNLSGIGPLLRFNELTNQIEWKGRPLREADYVDIQMLVEQAGFLPAKSDIPAAVNRVALDNAYNPITDYLDGLAWDGEPRLVRWMQRLLGAPDTEFVRTIGPKVLISAVARARDPGCKVDTVLVLEGDQGIRKSSAIAALFGEEYTAESVSLFDQHNKMVMQMMGAWVVELAEFVAFFKKDSASVKGLISMRSDKVVLPYAKVASTHPRRCVFFGTINPEDFGYLTDGTGNRRYWPVSVTKIDIDAIRKWRDQLWAEAQHLYRDGATWWLEKGEEALASQETAARQEQDAWEPLLREKLAGISSVTPTAAMKLLGIPYDRMDRKVQMRVATVLKALGYRRETPKDENRKTYIEWRKEPSS